MTLSPRLTVLMTLPPLMWAGNAVVGRSMAGSVPPLLLNAMRWGLALLLLLPLARRLLREPAALLERWRDRPDYGPLARLAAGECLVPDETAAAAEIRSALDRLVAEHALARLQALQEKAAGEPLSPAEKAELQHLLRSKAQSARPATPK